MDLPATSHLAIAPNGAGGERPRLSVVMPVYEPDRYLVEALRSVLSQDPGPELMQIAVVDDASPTSDVQALLQQATPPGRVEFYRTENNRGLSGNWNECLRVARGEIVHLLHQDDWVGNGFYNQLLPAFAADPSIGMAFCRHAFVDGENRVTRVSHRERWLPGAPVDWLHKISSHQRIQCASALVRRSVYEQLGGYRTDLHYALDWEMWVRIAAHHAVWYDPKVLAYYRRHENNETARLRNDGRLARDILNAIEIFAGYLPAGDREQLIGDAYGCYARRTLKRLDSQVRDPSLLGDDINELLGLVRVAMARATHSSVNTRRLRKQLTRVEQRA
jgi:GT2 family glycosyltransferase